MKINLDELLDNASPKELDGIFDNMEEEPVDEESMSRICNKVVPACSKKRNFPYRILTIAAAAVACLLLLFYFSVINNNSNRSVESTQPESSAKADTADTVMPAQDKAAYFEAPTDNNVVSIIDDKGPSADSSPDGDFFKEDIYNLDPDPAAVETISDPEITDTTDQKPKKNHPEYPDIFTNAENADSFQLYPVENNAGKIDSGEYVNGYFDTPIMTHSIYFGVNLFDIAEDTYLFLDDNYDLYKLQGNDFIKTGTKLRPNIIYSSSKIYKDYIYYSGSLFNAETGQIFEGLFKINIKTGETERCIECGEITSMTIADSKIYFVFSPDPHADSTIYFLKCFDIEKDQVTDLITYAPYIISDLTLNNDKVYFKAVQDGKTKICYFKSTSELYRDQDGDYAMELFTIPVDSCDTYAISNDKIYTHLSEKTNDGEELKNNSVIISEYDMSGNKTAQKDYPFMDVDPASTHFTGDQYSNKFTVFNGKIVEFDSTGFYLNDIKNNVEQKILDLNLTRLPSYQTAEYMNDIYMDVYCGKLYIFVNGIIGDDIKHTLPYQYIYEYDGNEIKRYNLLIYGPEMEIE